jgi:1-aminocyclopropane-1-carboxylate deaminase/D-cysteine desulfhydrase-like pyridoxal-dependent ACC family enzyme
VYTSKAFAKLLNDVESGDLGKHAPVLFLHTGGAPALFGYVEEIMAPGM